MQPHEGTEDLLQRIIDDLVSVMDVLEGRFLYLIREGARGALNLEAIATELSLLARDLKRCFRRLPEVQERRDLTFEMAKELHEAERRCIWLFRKIRAQQAALRKLTLEDKFRHLVSSEAFDLYQSLLDLDEQERESVLSDDEKIKGLINRTQE